MDAHSERKRDETATPPPCIFSKNFLIKMQYNPK
jgi:hypothetical protein